MEGVSAPGQHIITVMTDARRFCYGSTGAEGIGVSGKLTTKIGLVMTYFRIVKFSAGIVIS